MWKGSNSLCPAFQLLRTYGRACSLLLHLHLQRQGDGAEAGEGGVAGVEGVDHDRV